MVGKTSQETGACLQAWQPRSDLQIPLGDRKELTPKSYHLTSTYTLWLMDAPQIKYINKMQEYVGISTSPCLKGNELYHSHVHTWTFPYADWWSFSAASFQESSLSSTWDSLGFSFTFSWGYLVMFNLCIPEECFHVKIEPSWVCLKLETGLNLMHIRIFWTWLPFFPPTNPVQLSRDLRVD